jgi:hypothetical protein
VPQDLKDPWVKTALQDPLDLGEKLGLKVQQARKALKAHRERQDQQDHLELQDHLEVLEQPDSQDHEG